jgi:small subunit ribosomal protein S5
MQEKQDRRRNKEREEESPITERTVRINRVSKVVKGGRHLSFSALVVVGDGEGRVGIGMGKASAVPDAITKGSTYAQKNMVDIPLKGDTIAHDVTAKFGGSMVMLKPAPPGTGVIAGESVRAVVELAGVKDIVTKVRRSTNPTNVVKATLKGLQMLKDPGVEISRRREYAQRNELLQTEQASAEEEAE